MKTSLSVTVLNEESTIDWLLQALSEQLVEPDEIIIVDGGSADKTVAKIKRWQKRGEFGQKIKLFVKKGNRSVGRNLAISKAKNELIAITDAGCLPFPNWLQQLLRTQRENDVDVVAGYYQGLPQTSFQAAVVPYVLVTPNRVKPKTFLPATRSMLIKKNAWEKVGGFDESLDHNEDYAFAHKLESAGATRAFAGQAIVGWLPSKNLKEFTKMIYRFALGDIEAKILRPKVILIFARYLVFLGLLLWMIIIGQLERTGGFFPLLIFLYIWWSIAKNKKYVTQGWWWLPLLQVTSDLAIMTGSINGLYSWIKRKN